MIRDFHPLVFFYVFGIADVPRSGSGSGSRRSCSRILGNPIPPATVVLVALLLLFGSQFVAVRDVVRPRAEQGLR